MKSSVILKKLHLLRSEKLTFKDKLLLGILGLGFVLLIIFIFYLIWFSFSQKSIAHFLPEDKTVAYIEFEDFALPLKLETSEAFNKEQLEKVFNRLFGVDFKTAGIDWDKGCFGATLIGSSNSNSVPVFFMETGSRRKTLNLFKQLALPEEELAKSGTTRLPIYSYPQSHSFSFAFVGPYTFVSNNLTPLKIIQEVYNGEIPALTGQKDYQKSLSSLPRQNWISGYLNFQSLNFGDSITASNIIEPLKHVINHVALSVRKNQTGFHFNTFVNLTPDLLSLREGLDKTRFAYKLTDYISSKNLALYIGGANLSQEWQNTLDTISNLNPAYGVILESIIRAQITKVFGDQVSLRNDFYPLFEGEYALAVAKSEENDRTNVSLILSHSDQKFAETKLAKMMQGFKFLAAQFAPKLREVTLPDGTISRELVADTSKLQEITETYEGYNVHCVEVVNTSSGFCYTVTDELMVMANNLDTTTQTIDLTLSPKYVLSQHQPFRQTISNLSKVSDEITFIDIQKATPLITGKSYGMLFEPFLKEFEAVSWVKHYFDDGVSTEGYLLIK